MKEVRLSAANANTLRIVHISVIYLTQVSLISDCLELMAGYILGKTRYRFGIGEGVMLRPPELDHVLRPSDRMHNPPPVGFPCFSTDC